MQKPKVIEKFDFSTMAYFPDKISRNQKLAVLNFFSVIAASDANKQISKMKLAFITQYYKEFGVSGDQCLAYVLLGGRERTVADIKSLCEDDMQDLVYATTELFNCDSGMSEEQYSALRDWLDDIGMSIDEWHDLL